MKTTILILGITLVILLVGCQPDGDIPSQQPSEFCEDNDTDTNYCARSFSSHYRCYHGRCRGYKDICLERALLDYNMSGNINCIYSDYVCYCEGKILVEEEVTIERNNSIELIKGARYDYNEVFFRIR